MEKKAEYYDTMFEQKEMYQTDYKNSVYYVQWTQVIVFLKRIEKEIGNVKILEIGSGPGQLVGYLFDEGFTCYHGFDFSSKAIEVAQQKFLEASFQVGNALDTKSYEVDYNTVICLEVLEHVKRDVEVLKNIKAGAQVILSVPTFDVDSHVRWFTKEREIKKRYYRYIDFKVIKRIGNIYVCRGIRSDFKPSLFQRFLATREQVDYLSFVKRVRHHIKNVLKLK